MSQFLERYLPAVVQLPVRLGPLTAEDLKSAVAFPDIKLLSQPKDRRPLAGSSASGASLLQPPPYLDILHQCTSAAGAVQALTKACDVAKVLMR